MNRLADGAYLFVVTIRDLDEAMTQKFGILQISGRHVVLQNGSAESLSTSHLRVLTPSMIPVDRTNKVAKWIDDAGTLGDSSISEVAGRVGIGTTVPGGQLHIFGAAGLDVFSGMGPNLTAGPSMNFGYSGASFGRGSGFFNVRPDVLATPPNPSLRFMTGNLQRMIITNTGNVGIGTTSPTEKLQIDGNVRVNGISTVNGNIVALGNINATNTTGNFDIVKARVIQAESHYNLGDALLLRANANEVALGFNAGPGSSGNNNLFVGNDAGAVNESGSDNVFVGSEAGMSNDSGINNTFVGRRAGSFNTTATNNSFFGHAAGAGSLVGDSNSFFGSNSGAINNGGCCNSYFGSESGSSTTSASHNSFFGKNAGQYANGDYNSYFGEFAGTGDMSDGEYNAAFGHLAGNALKNGSRNTFFGALAGTTFRGGDFNTAVGYHAVGSINASENTFIGAEAGGDGNSSTAIGFRAYVAQSDSLVLGSIMGLNNAIVSTKVGIGTATPKTTLEIAGGRQYISTAGEGIILKSPDGNTCRHLTVADDGTLTLTALTCP